MSNKFLLKDLNKNLSKKDILQNLQILLKKFDNKKIVFSTSFSIEDQIITDIIFFNNLPIKIFTLDTGRLFEDTYKVLKKTIDFYKKKIFTFFPESQDIEKLYFEKGAFSFYLSLENRKECCFLRKVKPIKRALKGVECWITGIRATQSEARKKLDFFMWDENFNLIKYNPLLNWSLEDVNDYVKNKNLPYNNLYDKGFLSIGCEPCTRKIKKDEDIRSGRWWWENNTKKECGLH